MEVEVYFPKFKKAGRVLFPYPTGSVYYYKFDSKGLTTETQSLSGRENVFQNMIIDLTKDEFLDEMIRFELLFFSTTTLNSVLKDYYVSTISYLDKFGNSIKKEVYDRSMDFVGNEYSPGLSNKSVTASIDGSIGGDVSVVIHKDNFPETCVAIEFEMFGPTGTNYNQNNGAIRGIFSVYDLIPETTEYGGVQVSSGVNRNLLGGIVDNV